LRKRSCPYAPYIQTLNNAKWRETTSSRFPQKDIIVHEEKKLRVMKHEQPRSQAEKEATIWKSGTARAGPFGHAGSSAGGHPESSPPHRLERQDLEAAEEGQEDILLHARLRVSSLC